MQHFIVLIFAVHIKLNNVILDFKTVETHFGNSTKDEVRGNFKLVEGVKGNALKCDGFTTAVLRDD
jgi:hypothetical protein